MKNKNKEKHRAKAVVFLPGWGFDGRVLQLAETSLPWTCLPKFINPATLIKDLFVFLEKHEIYRIDLVGWSMGANMALDFATAHPEKVSSLYLLSMRQSWPKEEIEDIRKWLAENPQEFLKSFYRKCFLGHKKAYSQFVAELQEQYLEKMDLPVLLDGLEYLGTARDILSPDREVHCLHGKKDVIAPVLEMAQLPGCRSIIFENAGHAFFVDKGFTLPEKQRKNAIRKRFSKAANTYDEYANAQRELAQKLTDEFIPDADVKFVLEIGCGTGNYTTLLAKRYFDADILAIDFSPTMISAASKKLSQNSKVHFVCEDGENFLASARYSFDVITSNATMQWFDDIDIAFANAHRLLNEDGYFCGSVFGPKTLAELGKGLELVFEKNIQLPSNRFLSKNELSNLLNKYFSSVVLEEWCVSRRYESLSDLLTHIKKTGTGGWHSHTPLLTRGRLKILDNWFQEQHGCYQATYQAYLFRCKK